MVQLDTDLLVIVYCGASVGMAFGLPLPSMKAFVESSPDGGVAGGGLGMSATIYSLTVAAFNVGDFLGSLLAGILNRKMSVRSTFLLANVVGMLGGLLYAVAGAISSNSGWLAPFGRFLLGIWSGVANSMIRVFLVNKYTGAKLIPMMSLVGFLVTSLMAVSPALDGLLSKVPAGSSGFLWFDSFRASGWILCAVAFLGVVLVGLLMRKDDAAAPSAVVAQTSTAAPAQSTWWDTGNTNPLLIMTLIAAFFASSFGYTALETMATPLMSDQFGFPEFRTSIVYFVAGGVSSLLFASLYFVTQYKVANEKQICLLALLLLSLGFFLLSDWQFGSDSCQEWSCSYDIAEVCSTNITKVPCQASPSCIWNQDGLYGACDDCAPICHNPSHALGVNQFYVGFFFVNLAFIVGRVLSAGLYSKLLGKTPSTPWMQSVLNSIGSVARVIGPPLAICIYEANNWRTYGVMIFFGSFSFLVAIPYILLWRDFSWTKLYPNLTQTNETKPLLEVSVNADSAQQR